MKKSKIICALLVIAMLLSHCSFTFAAITDEDNGKMKYYKESTDSFDVKGYVNGALQSTTFMDGGYHAKLKVDNNGEETLYFKEDITKQVVNGIAWDIECSFINNGRYVKVTYILTNNNEAASTISLGAYADVQIGGDDYATIQRFENSNGLKLYNEEENIQFSFYGKAVAGTTDIDNLWIGTFPNQRDNCFSSNDTVEIKEKDSAFAYSWVNRKIEPRETKRYSVIIGIGEVSNAPKIELDANQGKCFSQDSVVINGMITDLDPNSKATLYYTIDNGEEKTLEEKTLTNNKLDFALDLTSQNLSIGTHKIKLWAIDESGNPSEVLEKEILISNLKAPVINMSEEWSKEPIKFTITDEQNNEDDVVKYQYKIGNGEWQDVELNTEVVALQETGTAVVMAKVLGKQTDEQSSIVSKTAKVDKSAPIVNIIEQNSQIIINVTDEHSGVDFIKYFIEINDEIHFPSDEKLNEYTGPIDCKNIGEGTALLYVLVVDKMGNECRCGKEYTNPVVGTIVTEESFTNKKPIYKLTDEKKQYEKNYIYQIKINDGEWQNVNVDTDYTIEEPAVGKNTIKTKTVDLLGRESQESIKEIVYIVEDNTLANDLLPDTGITTIIIATLVVLMLGIIGYMKYKKLKFIK